MQKESKLIMESKKLREFESILKELAAFGKVEGTLSVNDVGHALYLMKAFVAYPKNYG